VAGLLAAAVLPAQARVVRQDPWLQAVAMRDRLEASPEQERTRAQFDDVLNAFRRIYHENPTASKAPAAVAAVADLLAEKGRVLKDLRSLRAAVGQYEFLRDQYPDSPQVDNALLLEAEICRQDLKDGRCAEEKFQAVIAEKPGSSFAEQAAIELKEMRGTSAGVGGAGSGGSDSAGKPRRSTGGSPVRSAAGNGGTARPEPTRTQSSGMAASSQQVETARPLQPATPQAETADIEAKAEAFGTTRVAETGPRRIVQITGMRHWSNPTSTRIAIDLGGKVEYEAARVPNPERIFFDLHGTKLAPSLNGHQVEVIDDGYLKRIRAAQFQADTTRVVLDVSDVSQYSAFLLPNPWRLIIDIHSDKGASRQAIAQSKATADETLATGKTVATVSAGESPLPLGVGRAAEKGRSEKDSTISEVAKLSSEPSKVAATVGPTSGPVAAKVGVKQAMPQNELDAMNGPGAGTGAGDASKPALVGVGSASTSRSTKTGAASKKGAKGATADLNTASAVNNGGLPHAADPTADGQRSLVRALGLKVGRIVIDAGHGGHDSGTLGPGGIQEKDVVLDVALRVGKLLHQKLGAEIVYTRSDDTFIPLETRTAIANRAQADLFLSIHGNSSPEPSARGVETYYLNFTSDPDALDTAARENAVSTQSVHQLSDLVRKITLKDKIDESREFAADVDQGLYAGLKAGNPGLKDRGVKKAPFVVLIGAQMPSILAEISFLTNPDDAEQLQEGAYRQRIAEALDAGVERYLHGLSGTRAPDAGRSPSKRAAKSKVDGELPAGR